MGGGPEENLVVRFLSPDSWKQQVWVGCGQLHNAEDLAQGPPLCSRTLETSVPGDGYGVSVPPWHDCWRGVAAPGVC